MARINVRMFLQAMDMLHVYVLHIEDMLKRCLFMLQFLVLCRVLWLDLGTKNTWSGLGKHLALA